MLDEITFEHFIEWQRYYGEEPFGEWRADFRIGQLAALVANMFSDTKKRGKPFSPLDFVLSLDAKQEAQKRDILAPETHAWFMTMVERTKKGELPLPKSERLRLGK